MMGRRQANHLRPKGPAVPPQAAGAHARRPTAYGLHVAANRLRGASTRLLMGAVRLYQVLLSPFLGGQCRFHPTCSNYALHALESHGPIKGAWLAVRRLLKCHPFHPGGFDPPPRSKA